MFELVKEIKKDIRKQLRANKTCLARMVGFLANYQLLCL